MSPEVAVSEALDDLPNASEFPSLLESDSVHLTEERDRQGRAAASPYAKDLRREWQAAAWPRSGFDPRLLTNSARTNHRADVVQRFRRTKPGTVELKSRLPRLEGNGLASTIRAGTSRDHGSFTSARPIHHRFPRVITVREAARLHSYPDWFRFHSTKWHAFRQIGNSVPPLLARAVGAVVREALGIAEPGSPGDGIELGGDEALELSLNEAAPKAGLDPDLLPTDSRRTS